MREQEGATQGLAHTEQAEEGRKKGEQGTGRRRVDRNQQ